MTYTTLELNPLNLPYKPAVSAFFHLFSTSAFAHTQNHLDAFLLSGWKFPTSTDADTNPLDDPHCVYINIGLKRCKQTPGFSLLTSSISDSDDPSYMNPNHAMFQGDQRRFIAVATPYITPLAVRAPEEASKNSTICSVKLILLDVHVMRQSYCNSLVHLVALIK